jgi:hypothetical protein
LPVNGAGRRELASTPSEGLRDRVFALLDEQFTAEEALSLADDDPCVLWMTSRALGVDDQDVAGYVRQWRHHTISQAGVHAHD